MIKTYAYFVKNVIEPMIEKASDILFVLEKNGIQISKDGLSELIEKAFLAHVCHFIMSAIMYVTITSIICFTVYKVLV